MLAPIREDRGAQHVPVCGAELSIREGRRLEEAADGRRARRQAAAETDRSLDVPVKLFLWGPIFQFLGVNIGNYWRCTLFYIPILIWRVGKQ